MASTIQIRVEGYKPGAKVKPELGQISTRIRVAEPEEGESGHMKN